MSKFDIFSGIELIKNLVTSSEFLNIARKVKTAFTRKRKMSLSDILYFMISSSHKNMQYELDSFFSQKGSVSMSRQAFAKSREKLEPTAIRFLSEELLAKFEAEDTEISCLHGYRVFAVDGSIIDLPENSKLRDTFGYSSGTNGSSHCKAKAMICYDVLNHICPYGELISFFESETIHMHNISEYFSNIECYQNSIFLLDRAYPSFDLFSKMETNNQNYLARASKSFHKSIVNAPLNDQFVKINKNGKELTVRVIKFTLPSGITEILVTNLPTTFTYDELTKLYAKRWGVETAYNYIKNTILLECFTGESTTAVLQDFYISILLMNFIALVYREQEETLENKSKRAYKYKANTSHIARYIKVNFVKMLNAKTKFYKVFRGIFVYKNIIKYAYAQVDGRSRPRRDPKRHSTLKTHPKPRI